MYIPNKTSNLSQMEIMCLSVYTQNYITTDFTIPLVICITLTMILFLSKS